MIISKELDGREVLNYVVLDRTNDALRVIRPAENENFYYSSEYFGDHIENYIVHKRNGDIVTMSKLTEVIFVEFAKKEKK